MKSTKQIRTIPFKDVNIPVYYSKDVVSGCLWKRRNENAHYSGLIYVNIKTGEWSYPDDIMPLTPTKEDSEIIPKHIVINEETLTDNMLEIINNYLETEYKRKNNV